MSGEVRWPRPVPVGLYIADRTPNPKFMKHEHHVKFLILAGPCGSPNLPV